MTSAGGGVTVKVRWTLGIPHPHPGWARSQPETRQPHQNVAAITP